MPAPHKFRVIRASDRTIYEAIKGACEDCGMNMSIRAANTILETDGYLLASSTEQRMRDFEAILDIESICLKSIVLSTNAGIEVHVERTVDASKDGLSANSDTVQISTIDPTQFPEAVPKAMQLVSKIRRRLRPLDEVSYRDALSESDREFLSQKDAWLSQQQSVVDDLIRKLTKFSVEQGKEFNRRDAERDQRMLEKENELHESHEREIATLESRRRDLDEREKALDVQDATQKRRQYLKDVIEQLGKWQKSFEVTQGLRRRRLGVGFLYLSFVGITFWWVCEHVMGDEFAVTSGFSIGRQVVAGLSFIVAAALCLRWTNQTFVRRDNDEEIRHKRLVVDAMWAGFLVETGLEWSKTGEKAMPDLLLDRLSRSLFAEGGDDISSLTGAEAIAKLLQKKRVRFKAGDLQLDVGAKGVGRRTEGS